MLSTSLPSSSSLGPGSVRWGFPTIGNGLFSIGVVQSRNKKVCLLVSTSLLVSAWNMFGAERTHSADAPWAPSQELDFQVSLLWLTRYVVGRSHMQRWLRSNRAQGAERLPLGWPSACSAANHAGFVSHGKDTRMTASRSSWFRLSCPEGDAQHERVYWPYVLPRGLFISQ